jgi:preprotein translocase subunit Sec61beta
MPAREACIANIGPRQRRRRVMIGGASLAAGVVFTALVLAAGTSREWRLPAFVPIWAGMLSLLEARARTCVVLSARGMRNMDSGNERFTDEDELGQVRVQARRVHAQAFVAAVLITAMIFAI